MTMYTLPTPPLTIIARNTSSPSNFTFTLPPSPVFDAPFWFQIKSIMLEGSTSSTSAIVSCDIGLQNSYDTYTGGASSIMGAVTNLENIDSVNWVSTFCHKRGVAETCTFKITDDGLTAVSGLTGIVVIMTASPARGY